MAQGYGYTCYLGYKKEASYGAGGTIGKWIEIASESIKGDRQKMPAGTLGYRGQRRRAKGKFSGGGQISFPFLWTGCEQFLQCAFGTGSLGTTGPVSTIYTHTFSLKAALGETMALEINRDSVALGGSSAFFNTGGHVQKLRLKQEVDKPLMVEVDFLTNNRTNAALTTAGLTFPTFDICEFGNMSIAAIDPASANVALTCKEFNLELDNGTDVKYSLNDYKPTGVHAISTRKISLSAQVEYINNSAYDYYKNLVNAAMRFKWVHPVTANCDFQIDAANCTFTGEDPETGNEGPYYLNLKAEADVNSADNDEIVAVLRNTTAAPGT